MSDAVDGSDTRISILALRAIAASAEKLASDLERGKLWEGEYSKAVSEIQRHLRDLPDGRGR